MSNAALAFLSGLAGGYYQGKQDLDEKARRDQRDQREQEEHDARMAALKTKLDGDKALRVAGTPATVSNGATVNGVAATPTVYDNADVASSDVRQANRLAQLPAAAAGVPADDAQPVASSQPAAQVAPVTVDGSDTSTSGGPAAAPAAAPVAPAASMTAAPVVNGTAYQDPASAASAAASANTPQAIRARQVAALNGIDPERAMKLQATALTVDTAQAEQARKLKQEGVFDAAEAARRGDAQGVFDAFNKNGNLKLQGVPTVTPEVRDIPGVGKVTTYNYTGTMIGADGQPQPFQKNSHDLAMEVMPYEKALELEQKGTKEAREAKKTDAEVDELKARGRYYDAFGRERDAKANGGADGKPYKLDEDDKLRLSEATKNVQEAQKQVQDALGKLMPGDDPAKNPAVQFAQNNLRAAKLSHLRTNIELGQIPPESMVSQIMGVAKGPQDVIKSLNELASVSGTEFADKVTGLIQQNDQWKQWTATKPMAGSPGAQPKPAAAQGVGASAAPAPAAPAKTAAVSGPVSQDQIDAAGKRLDAAREVMRRLQANPLPDPVAWRETTRAAQQDLDAAQANYEQMVAAQTKPYIGRPMPRPAAAAGLAAR